ncbi:MAG: xanthine dehydrogenase family protein molybdopterin-binding subunit [Kofleriaceae bacterium]
MTLTRRELLRASAASAAGLVITFHHARREARAAGREAPKPASALPPANAFLRIGADDSVTVVLAHSEMGQGIWTGLAMLIAEELDCDWAKVRCEHAPAARVYGHPGFGMQMTGGSSTTNGEFTRYRTVGATAKDMLLRAAAARWKTTPSKLRVERGVIWRGKDSVTFGQVAAAAMALPPPKTVALKDPKDWKLLGTRVRRLDSPEKITGQAQFGMDVQFPGLRTAMIARPPAFGAKLGTFDPAPALAVPGVEKVFAVGDGVAVVAQHYWAAKQGRAALKIEWTPPAAGQTTAAFSEQLRALVKAPGAIAEHVGKVEDKLAGAAKRYEVEYEVPYLAHAPMEPLNCTVKLDGDRAEIWSGTQFQTGDQMAAAGVLGLKPEHVTIHTTFLGGGFGRRANPASDFVVEAARVAKGAGVPVKVVWSREDDLRGGYYRPAYVHRAQVGVDERGVPIAWDHVIAGQSIIAKTPFAAFLIKDGVDATSVEGVTESPYLHHVADRRVSLHSPDSDVTVLWWRSVGHTHTAFAMECLIDELAHAAGQDALAFRLALLGEGRHAAALKLAAEKAGWGKALPPGRAHGLAVHESFGSIVAQVAEVSVDGGKIRVHKVTAAVDCGTAVNPMGIEAQVQGSIAFGLSAALHSELTFDRGAVQQSNFHDYRVLRMFEMPEVAVHLINSGAPMGGIGEPATPPIAPAVANAVFALTKQRLRSLPLRLA